MTATHAPGWSWHKHTAGRVQQPWAWSQINGGRDLPAQAGGLCQSGWHADCPQAPNPAPAVPGTCTCDCHQQVEQLALPLGGAA